MIYKAVLFDMDGVIVDSEPLHVAAFQATIKEYGRNLSADEYKDFFAGRTDQAGFEKYFDFIGETVDMPVIMDKKAKKYLQIAADQLTPYPHIVEFIRELGERNVPLALVTGSLRAEAEVVLNTFDLAHYFTAVIAAEDISESKPNPEGYLKGATALQTSPEDCVIIEDAPSGVLAAKNAGIRCVAITNTHTSDELKEATIIVDSLQPGALESL